ncbi:MAG: bile acid:sodium symporter family protein [Spongiibacteraceae bacterium]|nr:bile acid:sodium symporter family protein [Spongiibacteraceae bacterium]
MASFALIGALGLFLLGTRSSEKLSQFSFTVSVVLVTVAAISFPQVFVSWGAFKLSALVIPLLQLIMFGMGTTMSLKDFAGVLKMPKAVGLGLVCQFTIMPLSGFLIVALLEVPPEMAAGIILLGASPSGLSSNVMTYIAKGNLALSVTLTAVATMVAPFMTPFLMEILAGEIVPIDAGAMMISMAKIVVVPVVAGLAYNYIVGDRFPAMATVLPKISMAGIIIIVGIVTAAGRDNLLAIGSVLVVAAILHNSAGYLLGYWSCRLTGVSVRDSRTIAIEVGLQNSGLAAGLALEMGKMATVGLPSAVFSSWMNFSGSFLANYWRAKPVDDSRL